MLALLLFVIMMPGCLGPSVAPETSSNIDPPSSSTDAGRSPRGDDQSPDQGAQSAGTSTSSDPQNTAREQPLPPAGPRPDAVWNGSYSCVLLPGGFGPCLRSSHQFEIRELHENITVTVRINAPGVVCCNSLAVSLILPDGTSQREWFGIGSYGGGEERTILVHDPALLNQPGEWTIALHGVDVAATTISYEARVAFATHPEFEKTGLKQKPPCENDSGEKHPRGRSCGPMPANVSLHMKELAVVNFPVPWETAAKLVVPGARPCGMPCVMILNEVREDPARSFALAQLWAFRYDEAAVDGVPMGAGIVGMVTLSVMPTDLDPPGTSWANYQPIMIAAPEPLAAAFEQWGLPVSTASIEFSLLDAVPGWVADVSFQGDGYEVDWRVGGLAEALSTTEEIYPLYAGNTAEFSGFVTWTENAGHHGLLTPVSVVGMIGQLGVVAAEGWGETAFYGDGPPVEGAHQLWEFHDIS